MIPGTYTLWSGDTQLAGQSSGGMFGGPGMEGFPGMKPEGMVPPEGMVLPDGTMPPMDGDRPEPSMDMGQSGRAEQPGEVSTEFPISNGPNRFSAIQQSCA